MTIRNPISRKAPAKTGMLRIPAFCVFMGLLNIGSAQADITNDARAVGTYNAQQYQSPIDSEAVPVTPALTGLVVTKTGIPDTNVTVGTVVTYTYTVLNNGTVTATNVALSDSHNGFGTPPVPSGEALTDVAPFGDSSDAAANNGVWTTLGPGDTVTMTATYTVTQADVDNNQ